MRGDEIFEIPDSDWVGSEERSLLTKLRTVLSELGPPELSAADVSISVSDGGIRLRIVHPHDSAVWLELGIDAGCTEIHWPVLTDVDVFINEEVEPLLRGALTTGVMQRRRIRMGRVSWSSLYVRSPSGDWELVWSSGGLAGLLRLLPISERVEALLFSLGAEPGARVIPDPMSG